MMTGCRAKVWMILGLLLCCIAISAQAERVTLAFGYEVDIPEGAAITKEKWTPGELDRVYLLEGTYAGGKERFQLALCDASQTLDYSPRNFNDCLNIVKGSVWATIFGSSDVGGKDGSDKYEMVFQQIIEICGAAEEALLNDSDYMAKIALQKFKRPTTIELDDDVYLDEGGIDIRKGMKVEYGNGKLIVEDENGRTIMWASKLPRLDIRYVEDDEIMLRNMIANMKSALELAGLDDEAYDLDKATLEDHAWRGIRKERCITAPKKNGDGFATIKTFYEGAQIVVYEGGASWDEAMAMANSAIIFYKEGKAEESFIPNIAGTAGNGLEYADKYTLPIGKNEYVVDFAEEFGHFESEDLKCEEDEYENGLQTAWGYENEYGVFDEILIYQYLPMPEEFQANTLKLTDEEYLEQVEKALGFLGEQYFDTLWAPVHVEENEELTVEVAKENAVLIAQMLDEAINGPQESYDTYFRLMDARVAVGYFLPIDREKEVPLGEHTMWSANGKRWVMTESFDLFGKRGRYDGAVALFDGALHLIGTLNPEYATSTFRRNDGTVMSPVKQEPAKSSAGGRTAVVATKSSPLTLRETPEKGGAKILAIPKGETVTVIEEGDWPLVEYHGKTGYVDGKYLR